MDALSVTLGLCFSISAAAVIAVCVPLVRGKVPRNAFYGVRLPEAFKSDQAWRDINRYGGRLLMRWMIPLLIGGVAIVPLRLIGHRGLVIALVFLPVLLVLIPLVRIMQFAAKYDRASQD